ncbi:serine/threonine-protein kinase [Streptomyces sp. cmx-18-6]|uniref:serine/threonine-protein kinase n=1 Tax=Streptomyces sp. cmx-18-6 TaxID=2790930 RepID=UPI00397F89E9
MAAVHRAHDTALGRTVAIKAMNPALAADPTGRERFRREARAAAALSHAHVVAVHDVFEEELAGVRVPYLVMEYVQGRTLSHSVPSRPGGLPLDEALRLVAEILDALAASHAGGLVHRDVKPANVMVTPGGSVKVMDFGIARALDAQATALTGTGYTVGTPHYMSPEQFESGRSIDARSDLYAVGVVLFQLLTGTVPFDADSGFRIGYLHVTAEPPALAALGAQAPAEVQALLTRALAKDPADRFPDARTMRAEVLRIRGSLSGPAAGGPGGGYVPTVAVPRPGPPPPQTAAPLGPPPTPRAVQQAATASLALGALAGCGVLVPVGLALTGSGGWLTAAIAAVAGGLLTAALVVGGLRLFRAQRRGAALAVRALSVLATVGAFSLVNNFKGGLLAERWPFMAGALAATAAVVGALVLQQRALRALPGEDVRQGPPPPLRGSVPGWAVASVAMTLVVGAAAGGAAVHTMSGPVTAEAGDGAKGGGKGEKSAGKVDAKTFDPCEIPEAAIRAAGLNPGSRKPYATSDTNSGCQWGASGDTQSLYVMRDPAGYGKHPADYRPVSISHPTLPALNGWQVCPDTGPDMGGPCMFLYNVLGGGGVEVQTWSPAGRSDREARLRDFVVELRPHLPAPDGP